jgi:hypothetical protein
MISEVINFNLNFNLGLNAKVAKPASDYCLKAW